MNIKKIIKEELDDFGWVKEIPDYYSFINKAFYFDPIAYGGDLPKEGSAERLRYANKIPLSYDAAGCAVTQAIQETNWKQYRVENVANNGIPVGPYVLLIHIASVWVPYTSEGKSAIANYSEIVKEMKLAIQDCARKLKGYLSSKFKAGRQAQRRSMFELYIPELAVSLAKITPAKESEIVSSLKKVLSKDQIKGETEAAEKEERIKGEEGEE